MTVTYSLSVANARLTGFSRLLLRWRGSIYKLLYREMAIFVAAYYGLSGTYRYVLSEKQREMFEKLSLYCEAFTHYIPLSFVLGFYVTLVVGRWWQQYMQIPWPDKCLILISGLVHGSTQRARLIRRTLARYLLLMQVFTCQAVSIAIYKRFPTLDHIEEAGFITPEERDAYEQVPSGHGRWWVPAQWFQTLLVKAREEKLIKEDIHLYQILEEMHVLRGYCGMMLAYDWISIPLVYTQTVTIATYTYFLATLMGRQYLDTEKGYHGHEVDLYIPIFTVLEFFFFMGWLKVAEQLINGYGEDDDDFDLHWCLERNTILSFYIVDNMHANNPEMVKDKFWDDPKPILPHTKSSLAASGKPFLGSALDLRLDPEELEVVQMPPIDEEENENAYSSTPGSPNLIDIESTNGDRDDTHHRGRFLSELRGSRFMNMLIGQSVDNVSKGVLRHARSEKNTNSAFPPFLMKTPQKRNRTTSLADNSMPDMSVPEQRMYLNHRQGDRQVMPASMSSYRHSPAPSRNESSIIVDHDMGSLADDDSVQGLEMGSLGGGSLRGFFPIMRDSNRIFRHPVDYVPDNNAQFHPSHLNFPKDQIENQTMDLAGATITIDQSNNNQSQSSSISTIPPPATGGQIKQTSHVVRIPSRCNSNNDCVFEEEEAGEKTPTHLPVDSLTSTENPIANTVDQDDNKNSPQSNSSEDSSSPSDSNQATVTSFTELLKAEKREKKSE